jgi:ribosomal protein S18 acetylase RimI-like enzyme
MQRGSPVRIRPFEHADEPRVIELWSDVFRDDPAWNDPAQMIRRKLTVQPELFLVAEIEARVVGTVLAGFDGVRGWIHHLCVDPEYRRLGVARALMKRAEVGLAALDCPKVNLQVRATNAGVVAFYEALGYSVEDRASLGKRIAR